MWLWERSRPHKRQVPTSLNLLCFPIYGPREKLYPQGCPDYRPLFRVATAHFERKETVMERLPFLYISFLPKELWPDLSLSLHLLLFNFRAISHFVKEPYFCHCENNFSLFPRRAYFFMFYMSRNFLNGSATVSFSRSTQLHSVS